MADDSPWARYGAYGLLFRRPRLLLRRGCSDAEVTVGDLLVGGVMQEADLQGILWGGALLTGDALLDAGSCLIIPLFLDAAAIALNGNSS